MSSDRGAEDDVEPSCFAVRPIPTDGTPGRPDHILCRRPLGHDGAHANNLYAWEQR